MNNLKKLLILQFTICVFAITAIFSLKHCSKVPGLNTEKNNVVLAPTGTKLNNKAFESVATSIPEIKNTLNKVPGIKKNFKNVNMYYSVATNKANTYILSKKDSITPNNDTSTVYTYQDQNISAKVIALSDSTIELKTNINDTLNVVLYWQRKWFLGRKHYTVAITNTDSTVHFTPRISIVKK